MFFLRNGNASRACLPITSVTPYPDDRNGTGVRDGMHCAPGPRSHVARAHRLEADTPHAQADPVSAYNGSCDVSRFPWSRTTPDASGLAPTGRERNVPRRAHTRGGSPQDLAASRHVCAPQDLAARSCRVRLYASRSCIIPRPSLTSASRAHGSFVTGRSPRSPGGTYTHGVGSHGLA